MNKDIINLTSNKYIYNILENLEIEIDVEKCHSEIPIKELFQMAARENKMRSFLFVSKLLGKHIPIDPKDGIYAAMVLRETYRDFLNKKTLFIGFCETATGLAQSVFRNFEGDVSYIHTTRENIPDIEPVLEFHEEHSHAKNHKIYALDEGIIKDAEKIILVDDEITTGKTIINIINQINERYGNTDFSVFTLLDWRDENSIDTYKKLELKLGKPIKVHSLLKGKVKLNGNFDFSNKTPLNNQNNDLQKKPYIKLRNFCMEDILDRDKNEHLLIKNHIKETGRFGITIEENKKLEKKLEKIGDFLKNKRKYDKTLVLGTKEFMYIPMFTAAYMGENIKFQSTTISPIHPFDKDEYGAKSKIQFEDPCEEGQINYLYNIKNNEYEEVFIFLEREISNLKRISSMLIELQKLGIREVNIVYFLEKEKSFSSGSYEDNDIIFLLKDLSLIEMEKETTEREKAIQAGIHYSEMLPVEYSPSEEYLKLFHRSLEENKDKVALATAIVGEKIIKRNGKDIVLVSLARAGSPIGILIKKYIEEKFSYEVPHYSISIIRGKGLDKNAMKYILSRHPFKKIQFVDGWTGKGAISIELQKSCKELSEELNVELDSTLAVLSDTGGCSSLYGTREDFLIPSSCLNSTVSGLMSRTVHRKDLIGEDDFHGGKFYKELLEEDLSRYFIEEITSQFSKYKAIDPSFISEEESIHWHGMKSVKMIGETYGIKDTNLIKPGIGETTRVLLRRIPWKVLIKNPKNENLKHILLLAKERDVEVEIFDDMYYECCGIIKDLKGE
ncbi:pyrimidine operon attenuation protein/uracil phosphoribosyltransferase [Acetoanaerobium pronyense]|uniref:Pyrimidine operon attenuation protein/uracil phosphoribosyltransferase n=1 Tax=Acetoanaerobium pronyense TaxID=1482736 RepID=A0ABS4KF31_9FIRM|nr:phosphoribosyltransferase [Acetoanaerobium pronyense]MBP2026363.1 pyrimidine operon attenuation protein/uracil phosphoribosyltransferase [Acetoanaerobium pronyense]